MNDRETRRYDMFARVRTFGKDRSTDFAPGSTAAGHFAKAPATPNAPPAGKKPPPPPPPPRPPRRNSRLASALALRRNAPDFRRGASTAANVLSALAAELTAA